MNIDKRKQVHRTLRNAVFYHLAYRIRNQIRTQVTAQVTAQVCNQARNQIWLEAREKAK